MRIRPAPLGVAVAHALGLDRRKLVDTAQGRFLLNLASQSVQRILRGNYELAIVSIPRRLLKPGMTFVDVGANEGYFSIVASLLVGDSGKVISVEPQSRLQEVILANAAANNRHVELLRYVLSNENGVAEIYLAPKTNNGASGFFARTKYRLPTEQVAALTLEAFLDRTGLNRVDLMKIDAEGAEWDILMPESAQRILRQGRIAAIIVEMHPDVFGRRGLSLETFDETMKSCGYARESPEGAWLFAGAVFGH
jgi:FkbM family methyltransferase